jgi:hypothetical protein
MREGQLRWHAEQAAYGLLLVVILGAAAFGGVMLAKAIWYVQVPVTLALSAGALGIPAYNSWKERRKHR